MSGNRKRLALIGIGFLLVLGLIIGGAVTAAYAYREYVSPRLESDRNLALQDEVEEEETDLAPAEEGVLVMRVDPDSPAAAAGLQRGSIITAVDGEAVNTPLELHQAIQQHEAGDTITLTVTFGAETQEITVTLASAGPYLGVDIGGPGLGVHGGRPFLPGFGGPEVFPAPFQGGPGFPDHPFDGTLEVQITVAEVLPDTPAAEAGLQAGDVITAVDGESVDFPNKVQELIRGKNPGDTITLTVQRGDETLELTATLGEHPDDADRAYLGVHLTIEVQRELDIQPEEVRPGA
ncbi:MAG: PDZ domain-containing protein [Chloroflexota bacterium]